MLENLLKNSKNVRKFNKTLFKERFKVQTRSDIHRLPDTLPCGKYSSHVLLISVLVRAKFVQ